ncbi:hypothetical protein F5972_14130 [Microbispora cellulosiformans]|uniref:Gram-positive cocci surface proteins LPxTG domain-containing protein n=1 Tax=Microbispora cellulosiformans TaxID=2614688 RepID=A0A5J5K7P0_9ACTN|nr:hypothetical protein [Microbispora cellulosiformans]KAA9379291.1 hypothetical protein F5972_14130 [Microbispora cellulosiformans]
MLKNGVLLAVAAVTMICGPTLGVPAAVSASTTQDYPPTPPPLPPEFGRAEALLRLAIELDAAATDVRRRVDRLCFRLFGVEACIVNFGATIPFRTTGATGTSRAASSPRVSSAEAREIAAEAARLAAEADAIAAKAAKVAAEARDLARTFAGISPPTARTASRAARVATHAVETARGAAKLARIIERAALAAISKACGDGCDEQGTEVRPVLIPLSGSGKPRADDDNGDCTGGQCGNAPFGTDFIGWPQGAFANNPAAHSANNFSDLPDGFSVNPGTGDRGEQEPPIAGRPVEAGGEQAGAPAGEHGAPGHEDHGCSGEDCASEEGDTEDGDAEDGDAPEAADAPEAPAGAKSGAQGGGGLPFTGAPMAALAAVGAGLLALAAGLLAAARRRRSRPGRR